MANPRNTIIQKNYGDVFEEHVARVALAPGMVLEPHPDAGEVSPHSTQGGKMVPMVAIEDLNDMRGGGIDENYPEGGQVSVWMPQVGDQALLILQDEEDVAAGDYLDSNGDGTLRKNDNGANSLFQAIESMDLTASSGAEDEHELLGYDKRILVRRVA